MCSASPKFGLRGLGGFFFGGTNFCHFVKSIFVKRIILSQIP